MLALAGICLFIGAVGIANITLGIVTILVVALVQGWTPVVDTRLAVGAPAIGLIVGAVAGLYPSLRAFRIQPIEALRR